MLGGLIKSMKAQILKPTPENFKLCSKVLHDGGLVAFPTETVYGLGANALNREAVCDIFKAKDRPFNDPVIVHVLSSEDADKYIDVCDEERTIFHHLSKAFWPGPLTIVMKAKDILPKELSAGTGKVGFRCPNQELARELIRVSGLPIAAPSANKFGHISPTRAEHVFADLNEWPVQIIDGGEVVCQVGIESTVIGLDVEHHNVSSLVVMIILFRRGGISDIAIQQCLKDAGIDMGICEPVKHVAMKMEEAQVAPGQLITHYAPRCDAFLAELHDNVPLPPILRERIQQTVILDYNGLLAPYKTYCLKYLSFSNTYEHYVIHLRRNIIGRGDIAEAMRNIYTLLHEAESIPNVQLILLPDFSHESDVLAPSVMDRIVRATSGRLLQVPRLPVF